jgi:hypothetical protein
VRDLVAIADQRLTEKEVRCHVEELLSKKCSEQLWPLAHRRCPAKAGAGPRSCDLVTARNRTTISPSVQQKAFGIGLISFLVEDGTIMLGAEFSQGRGNLRSRTSCGLSVQVD